MKQELVTLQVTTRQQGLLLKLLDKLISEGTGTVERYCLSPNRGQAQDDLISLDGVAKRLRKSGKSSANGSQSHELLCIEWPEDVDGDGRGQLTDAFFKFADENSISIGQQIIMLALFAAAGAQLGARLSEHDFTRAMEYIKELAGGKINFTTMQGYSDEQK